MTLRRLLALALTALAVLGVGAGASAAATTQAAWTDRTYVRAVAASGTWAPVNACTAYDKSNKVVAGCRVTAVTYDGWGTVGDRTRNYYVQFSAPAATSYMIFNVDLTTGTTTTGDTVPFAWTRAGVAANPQFTAEQGWTCSALPRVNGRTPAGWSWTADTRIFFTVYENKTGKSTYCG